MVDKKSLTAQVSLPPDISGELENNPTIDPNIDFYNWLTSHSYKVKIEALNGDTPFLPEHGFVLIDKPLLVVKVVKKENQ